MKTLVVRILWPQVQQDISQWQCECLVDGHLADLENYGLCAVLEYAASLKSAGVDVSLIIPAELSLFDKVKLPARSQRQAMQALPFVVEEQLADDIEHVHLAIGGKASDGSWPVLVIDRVFLRSLLDLCNSKHILPVSAVVDAEALPVTDGGLSVLMHGERVLIHSAVVATAIAIEDAATVLHLLTQEVRVKTVQFWYESDNEQQKLLMEQLVAEFSALDDVQTGVEVLSVPLGHFLAGKLPSAINILQGDFYTRPVQKGMAWWQLAAAIVIFAWLGQLGLQTASGWVFNRGARILEGLAEQQYRKLYPEARQVSNPRKRLVSRLSADGAAEGDASFAYMLGASVQAFQSVPSRDGFSIKQLRYEGKRGELEMELTAKSIDQLDQFKQALDKAGLQAKISSANEAEGGFISGRMQIMAGA